jgi:hypothetical protein
MSTERNAGADGRDETPNERYDRNWIELLQEFRVVQTGTQILAGFLLTLPFLDGFETGLYLVLAFLAVALTLLALGSVSIHRLLFRHGEKQQLVASTNRLLLVCLAMASVLFAGITLFVFSFVVNRAAGVVAAIAIALIASILWVVVPLRLRRAKAK